MTPPRAFEIDGGMAAWRPDATAPRFDRDSEAETLSLFLLREPHGFERPLPRLVHAKRGHSLPASRP